MTRATNVPHKRQRRKKIINLAKGYFGVKHRLFKSAKEQNMRSLVYSFRDRKQKKRKIRQMWISRLNQSTREHKMTYSKFIHLLKLAQIHLNRKQLSEMAINQPQHFATLVEKIQNPWN